MATHVRLGGSSSGYATATAALGNYQPIVDVSEQWYFTKEDLMNTPSQAGSDYSTPGTKTYSLTEERSWRSRGCNFIHNAVKRLDMRRATAPADEDMGNMSARDYSRQIAGACVLLASKVEENKRSLKDIAYACAYVSAKGRTKEATVQQDIWQRLLQKLEIVVLENCCFDLDVAHPYGYIDTLAPEFGIPVFVAKSATAHVNDCLRSPICLLYRPEVIAVAALYLAIGVHGCDVKADLFDSCKVSLPPGAQREVEACAMDMLDFYRREADVEREAMTLQQMNRQSPQFS
ncbi:hypothetical protein IW140_002019 [Coemansia sp. RSA 1813]|nr:hypothetical protein LPJ74_000437 [Coemansia sp. RSA 1843]KAJ2570831.1 hypothetical protein IW140_002019 [Coemansia sp. RSA 1813]